MSLSASQQGDEPGPATRRAASPRRARSRSWRAFLLIAALVTVGLLTAACGGGSFGSVRTSTLLSGTNSTLSSLDQAGYRDVGIHLTPGPGVPPDGLVGISYSAGPAGNAETDVYDAERIVWKTLRFRFAVLTISLSSGRCVQGLFCVSSSTETGSETYAQLRAEFGSRPAGLDKTSVSQTDPIPSWLPRVVGVCVLAAAITIVAAVTRARHRAGAGHIT